VSAASRMRCSSAGDMSTSRSAEPRPEELPEPIWTHLSRTAAHLAMNHREWSLDECVERAASLDASQNVPTQHAGPHRVGGA
jgi:hypothetical protein